MNPFVECQLPSAGRHYYGSLPDGIVKIRSFTTEEEAILNSTGIPVSERFNLFIDRCLQLPEDFGYTIPNTKLSFRGPGALLNSDRLALLANIRFVSVGLDFTVRRTCSRCNSEFEAKVNLQESMTGTNDEVRLQKAEEAKITIGDEPILITLPVSKRQIGVRMLRGSDESWIINRSRSTASRSRGDRSVIVTAARQIVTLDGKEVDAQNTSVAEEFVSNMVAMDRNAMMKMLSYYDTGISASFEVICPLCGATNTVSFGSDMAEFFRPT